MTKLADFYAHKAAFQQDGQADQGKWDALEEQLIREELLPELMQQLKSTLSQVKRPLMLNVSYDPQGALAASFTFNCMQMSVPVSTVVVPVADNKVAVPIPEPISHKACEPTTAEEVTAIDQDYPEYSSTLFSKAVDWSVLNFGFTVPIPFHFAVEHALGQPIPRGQSVPVKVIFDHVVHDAKILKDINGVMQVLWRRNSSIVMAFRDRYPEAYTFLLEARKSDNNAPGRKKLPDNLSQKFNFCNTTEEKIFLIIPEEPQHQGVAAYQANADTAANWQFRSRRPSRAILEVFKHLNETGKLDALVPYFRQIGDRPNRILQKNGCFKMANVMINTTIDDLELRNEGTPRWYEEPFVIAGKTYFLSNQWRVDGGNGLQFSEFKKMIDALYPGMFVITTNDNEYIIQTR